ncbi:TATA element modulatory factor-like [Xenia sp. Carnegie-2017]|uniref:TATA element modulatory factor-like n=1 Tax=Xenia sp. Carnegie-2017 TaxID=2897299 RepID=UPI001F04328D|nr:TATA element modulatory factor-like [Xenia sp. Carnegie-2017]
MNWLDSSSFSGFLSQAQKSIDKVLDIPGDDDSTAKKQSVKEETSVSNSNSKSPQKKRKNDKKSSGNWQTVADSFWGSFAQTAGNSSTNADKEDISQETKINKTSGKSTNAPLKESKLSSSKQLNSKRNSKRKVNKKKAEESCQVDGSSTDDKIIRTVDKYEMNKEDSQLNVKSDLQMNSIDDIDIPNNEAKQNRDVLQDVVIPTNVVEIDRKTGNVRKNVIESKGQEEVGFQELEANDNSSGINNEKGKNTETQQITDYEHEESIEGMLAENENKINTAENKLLRTNNEQLPDRKQEETVVSNVQSSESSFSALPDDVSTLERIVGSQCLVDDDKCGQTKNVSLTISNYDNQETLIQGIDEAIEDKQQQCTVHIDNDGKEQFGDSEESNKAILENDVLTTTVSNDELDLNQENKRLLQVIHVRESKLLELSKQNLNLQETNAILRSQINQLEEIHRSEDAELEEMKIEFTKRIGDSESKMHAYAKERDALKKKLEETEQCLNTDTERQMKDFQALSKEKDQQIAQLMEEGEKLSKQILQRNNNIKKLREKEKELNSSNENLRSRLDSAEAELERLTGILKDRDHHEKEREEAIKKLNAYTQKQEEIIAAQKTELEESSSKLPSLKTALDNAYKEITELHKLNAAKSTEVQEATLSVEMTAKEELRIALEKLKKESQKECDMLAMEVSDLQGQLSRSEQQAARREDKLKQEILDIQMRLQEEEGRNQELSQNVSVATRPLLRQIENLQHSHGSQQMSWEKLERNLTERLTDAQTQLATAQEKERAATERSLELSSKLAALESQVSNYRQEKSRIEAELEVERTKLEELEDFKSKESGKLEAFKMKHKKEMDTLTIEKSLLEQQLAVEKTKLETERKRISKLEEQMKEESWKGERKSSGDNEDDERMSTSSQHKRRNSSSSSVVSFSDTMTRSLPSGSTAVLEELRATIRHKEGELMSMQSSIETLETGRESLTKELTALMNRNENLAKENKQLRNLSKTFQELQGKYNALLQMYGEKQEETEELKLDLQDIKSMYKAQIQELLTQR